MNLIKLADLFYKLSAYDENQNLESLIHSDAKLPANWISKSDLRNSVERVKNLNPSSENDFIIVEGYKFCKKLISLVDQLKEHSDEDLSVIKSDVLKISELLNINSEKEVDVISQFPHVSAFLSFVKPSKRVEVSTQKERMAISRVIGVCSKMMSRFDELEKSTGKIPVKFIKEDIESPVYEKPIPGQIIRTPEKMQEFFIFHGDELEIPSVEALMQALSQATQQTLVLFRTVYNSFKRGNSDPANLELLREVLKKEFEFQRRENKSKERGLMPGIGPK